MQVGLSAGGSEGGVLFYWVEFSGVVMLRNA